MLNKIIILLVIILVCVVGYHLIFNTEKFSTLQQLQPTTPPQHSGLLGLLMPQQATSQQSGLLGISMPQQAVSQQSGLLGISMPQQAVSQDAMPQPHHIVDSHIVTTTYDDKIKNLNNELTNLVTRLNNNPKELEIQNNNINYLLNSFISSKFFTQKEIFEKDLSGLFSLLHLLDEKNKKLLVIIINKMMNLGTKIKHVITPMNRTINSF